MNSKPLAVAGLGQEGPGLSGIVAVQILEALIPRHIPDTRPEHTVELGMVTHAPDDLHPTTQKIISNGFAVDSHVHRLSDCLVHKGHLGVQLVRASKVHAAKFHWCWIAGSGLTRICMPLAIASFCKARWTSRDVHFATTA